MDSIISRTGLRVPVETKTYAPPHTAGRPEYQTNHKLAGVPDVMSLTHDTDTLDASSSVRCVVASWSPTRDVTPVADNPPDSNDRLQKVVLEPR